MEIQATYDEDAITKSAAQRLLDNLPYEVDTTEVETAVRERVRDLCSSARVRTFVAIFAERQARELLDRRADRRGAAVTVSQ